MEDDRSPENLAYRAIDPPWHFANLHVYERAFELNRQLDIIESELELLNQTGVLLEENPRQLTRERLDKAKWAITRLMEAVEVVQWVFPDLAYEYWFGIFRGDVAHAYWRIEDGKFDNVSNDERQLGSFKQEVRRIIQHTSESHRQGLHGRLRDYLEHIDRSFHPTNDPEKYEKEIREAGDLFCLRYYSTALIVLGRAVETALLELGQARNIESVQAHNQIIPWQEARFFFRNRALYRADMPGEHGKVLSDKQFHQISILIDYRNNVAHSEYRNISRSKAIRQCEDALDLLRELEEIRETLEDSDIEIPEITEQKVQ